MKKVLDLRIIRSERVAANTVLLGAMPVGEALPECQPGQFAQLRADVSGAFLRRPISIHDVEGNAISFLVQEVGEGSRWLAARSEGDIVNAVLPLGHGFSISQFHNFSISRGVSPLLIGGGVGVAPLLFLGRRLKAKGVTPTFLLGGRSADNLVRLDAYRQLGPVLITTEDGSLGEHGFVTQHSHLSHLTSHFSPLTIYTCGPTPMMKAVARWAAEHDVPCEVSLENHMACGVGACLCCVEQLADGHNHCVCTDGPVFNAREWLISPIPASPRGGEGQVAK